MSSLTLSIVTTIYAFNRSIYDYGKLKVCLLHEGTRRSREVARRGRRWNLIRPIWLAAPKVLPTHPRSLRASIAIFESRRSAPVIVRYNFIASIVRPLRTSSRTSASCGSLIETGVLLEETGLMCCTSPRALLQNCPPRHTPNTIPQANAARTGSI